MKRLLLCALLVVGMTAVARAAEDTSTSAPKDVRRALDRLYGKDAKIDYTGTRDINGVTCYTVRVETDDGKRGALVSENGDFLNAGRPARENEQLPGPVRATMQDLFKDVPERFDVQAMTY